MSVYVFMRMPTKLEKKSACVPSAQLSSWFLTYTCLPPQFYFAVQSGGSFDVDFEIKDPNDKVILDGQRDRQGDYVFTANTVGEYSFCFENDMSTLTDKLVDFDIMVESEPRREAPAKAGQIQEQTSELEESIYRLNSQFLSIKRTQK
jgi:emp24/gp25L/p24 family/GOLD